MQLFAHQLGALAVRRIVRQHPEAVRCVMSPIPKELLRRRGRCATIKNLTRAATPLVTPVIAPSCCVEQRRVVGFEVGITDQNFFPVRARRYQLKNVHHANTHATDARSACALRGTKRNAIEQI